MKPFPKNGKPFLSVIVPVFNESQRLELGLKTITGYLKGSSFPAELVVVNDGSTDDTYVKLVRLQKTIPFRLYSYRKNRGKGFAVRNGMLESRGAWRLFTDVDMSTPIHTFSSVLPHMKNFDVIIGSRRTVGAQVLRHQSPLREGLGHGFTKLSQFVLQAPVSDFTCGFKCFSASSARKIFSYSVIERWGFDSEVLFLANRLGYRIKEIPVSWKNDTRSKVKFPEDMISSLADLLRIRFNRYSFQK